MPKRRGSCNRLAACASPDEIMSAAPSPEQDAEAHEADGEEAEGEAAAGKESKKSKKSKQSKLSPEPSTKTDRDRQNAADVVTKIVVTEVRRELEAAEAVREEEESPEPPLAQTRITPTGAVLRHKNAPRAPIFLIDTRQGKLFTGKYQKLVTALRKTYGATAADSNPNSLGIARFAGWVVTSTHKPVKGSADNHVHRWWPPASWDLDGSLVGANGLSTPQAQALLDHPPAAVSVQADKQQAEMKQAACAGEVVQ